MEKKREYTIYDLAKELNTSASTVSRALSNHPAISIAMRKKVKELALEKGYQSNTFAKNLRTRKTHTIGVIVPHIESYFVSSVMAGMEKILNEQNYNLILSQSFESEDKEITNAETMFHNRVDGLLVSLAGNTTETSHLQKFYDKGIPVVLFDRVTYKINSIRVVIDNFKAAWEATNHLIEQGCKNIVHIAGNLNCSVYNERLNGYKQALIDNSIEFLDENVISRDLFSIAGEKAAGEILCRSTKVDGIFAANDSSAIACMSVLMDAGIKVPEDICIVGFNNDPMTKYVEPKLTTIDYPGNLMGEFAAKRLLQLIETKQTKNQNEIITLDYKLIVRDSSRRNKQF